MDIVERAAALLGTASAGGRRREGRELREAQLVDLMEERKRAESAPGAHSPREVETILVEERCLPEEQAAEGPRIEIDMAWLREQRVITPQEKRTMMTESFRRVKRHIIANVASGGTGRNLVMITSALPGEGKTFCAVNLAMSLALEIGRTVMLVDADFEHRSVPRMLGIPTDGVRGFTDVVTDRTIALQDVLLRTSVDKLTLLPAGTPHAHVTELVAGEATAALLDQIARRYTDRIVIFDSGPLLAASEACALAAYMGQIVLVVEAGKTTESIVKEALERIASCNVAGVLLNKGAPPSGRGEYGYEYGAAG
jgi:receptor protein-tyrosine kinase